MYGYNEKTKKYYGGAGLVGDSSIKLTGVLFRYAGAFEVVDICEVEANRQQDEHIKALKAEHEFEMDEIERFAHKMLKTKEAGHLKIVRGIFEVYDQYVKLLGEEINDLAGLNIAHGWKGSSKERVELGKRLRTEIEALKAESLQEEK